MSKPDLLVMSKGTLNQVLTSFTFSETRITVRHGKRL